MAEKVDRDILNAARAVKKVYESQEWPIIQALLERHKEALRIKNEDANLPERDRCFLLGQLWALRYLIELPKSVAERVKLTEAMANPPKAEDPYMDPNEENPDGGGD